LRAALNDPQVMVNDQSATALNLLGPVGAALVILVGIAIAVWLWRSPRPDRGTYWGWPLLGAAVGLFTGLVWLLAQTGGSNYTFGTSGVPTSLFLALTTGSPLWSAWITIALVSLVPGAFIAASTAGALWVRGESVRRYLELAVGGLLMGIGAAIAGGCNLGHSLVGVPLLSLGSITTTVSMFAGVWLADRAIRVWGAAGSKPVIAERQLTISN
ncbi:MAG TPA: YeeE/YedE thiosulfate transporter family protein, partial [Anaerolineae bacterium]